MNRLLIKLKQYLSGESYSVVKTIIPDESEHLQLFAFYEHGIKVGEILLGKRINCSKHEIYHIYSDKKGYGRIILGYVLNLKEVDTLYGFSLEESAEFWKSVGATFETDHHFEINKRNNREYKNQIICLGKG